MALLSGKQRYFDVIAVFGLICDSDTDSDICVEMAAMNLIGMHLPWELLVDPIHLQFQIK